MSSVITNSNGAFGYTDLKTKLWHNDTPMLASAAVTAGLVVALGTQGKVAVAATNGTASLVVGVCAGGAASGTTALVTTHGYASGLAEGTIAAGDILKRSATTTGAVAATATPAAGEAIGVAINASSGGRVDMWLKGIALS